MQMKLYGADVCPFVHRVRLVLAEKRVQHDYIAIDLANKPDWFYEVLPSGKVPLLEHNGHRIWESGIICEYLDEAFLNPKFLPEDPGERAKIRLTIEWINSGLVAPFYKFLAAQDSEQQTLYRNEVSEALEEMDRRLQESPSLYFSSKISLADLALYPWFERWCVLEEYRDFPLPSGLSAVNDWLEALKGRASVQELRGNDEFFIAQYRSYADGSRA